MLPFYQIQLGLTVATVVVAAILACRFVPRLWSPLDPALDRRDALADAGARQSIERARAATHAHLQADLDEICRRAGGSEDAAGRLAAAARELLGKRLRAHVAAVESARSRLRRAELSRAALGDAVAASERTFGRAREQLVDAARALCAAKARGTALAAALGAVDDEARWAVVELGAVLEDHG